MVDPRRLEKSLLHESRVLILAFPFATPAMVTPVGKMGRIFSSFCSKVYVVGSDYFSASKELPPGVRRVVLKSVLQYAKGDWRRLSSIFRWLIMNVSAQLEMGWHLWRLRREVDIILCTSGCYYQIPCLLARVLGKKIFCSAFGVDTEIAMANHGRTVAGILSVLCSFNYCLAEKIIVDSTQTMETPVHKRFIRKVVIGNRYVEDEFREQIPHGDREKVIGYIGRISKEKGILDFARALPGFLSHNPDATVMIIGSGPLDQALEEELQKMHLCRKVTRIPWITHDEVPGSLNRLWLLVVPSLTEGSPNVILEAMACGTPVLATRAGGIPSLIVDGVSGFLMEDASPDGISQAIARVLTHPNLQKIIWTGQKIIADDYSFSACEKRYRGIIK